MRFEDLQLVRLMSGPTQSGFFAQEALRSIAAAAFRIDPDVLSPPWSAVFDELRAAEPFGDRHGARIEARWDAAAMRAEGMVEIEGRAGVLEGVDAVWRGAVVARAQIGGGRIAELGGAFPALGDVDAAIDAGGAPPPASGPARDAARAGEIARRLSLAAGRAGSVTAADVTDLLAPAGGAGAVMETVGAAARPGGFSVRFETDAPAVAVPVRLTLSAAVLIRDPAAAEFSIGGLLRQTRRAQALLAAEAPPLQEVAGAPRRLPAAAVWVVPAAWFDDPDWPGADPAARLAGASAWLKTYGIAVVAQPPA